MNRPNDGKAWSREQDQSLVQLIKQGLDYYEIADRLGRTAGAVISRAEYIAEMNSRFAVARAKLNG